MQGSKERTWSSGDGRDADLDPGRDKQDATTAAGKDDDREVDGWQQYRRWISKAPVPNRRRSGLDPSLYTWKGYRNWTEQVKRNWNDS